MTSPPADEVSAIVCDIVVVGAGLGGISAAARAAEQGRDVVLIEARDRLGGTAAYSGGGVHIWGAKTWAAYQALAPLADPALARPVFDGFAGYVDWLASTGAPGAFGTTALRGLALEKYQIGLTIAPRDRALWFEFMGRRIERLGGRLLLGARADRLIRRAGVVAGVEAMTARGRIAVRASAVILACGGFQANPALLEQYVSAGGELMARSVPEDRGDGLRMALEAGAALSPDMGSIYGHLMPAPPCVIDWSDPLDPMLLTAFYAEHGLVLNANGERFVDEGAGEANGETINAAAAQPPGGLWIVLDEAARRGGAQYELPAEVLTPANLRYVRLLPYLSLRRRGGRAVVVMDSLRVARDRGAVVINAPSLEALVDRMADHGVEREGLKATLAGFNAWAAGGAPSPRVPKSRSAHPITTAPFWAIKVMAGVSMTYGGVAIDAEARALDAGGAPIEGLYAVPGTAGGVNRVHYAGALAACGVYGLISADGACRSSPSRSPSIRA